MIVPAPVQAAMAAALGDDEHAREQRARYAAPAGGPARPALDAAGLPVEHSEAGLYLWADPPDETAGRRPSCWPPSAGILVAPGASTAPAGARHVRVALTATDERSRRRGGRLGELA